MWLLMRHLVELGWLIRHQETDTFAVAIRGSSLRADLLYCVCSPLSAIGRQHSPQINIQQ